MASNELVHFVAYWNHRPHGRPCGMCGARIETDNDGTSNFNLVTCPKCVEPQVRSALGNIIYMAKYVGANVTLAKPEWLDAPNSVGWWQIIQQNGDTEIVEVLAGPSKSDGAPELYFQATGSEEDYFLYEQWAPKLWRKVELASAPQKESGQ